MAAVIHGLPQGTPPAALVSAPLPRRLRVGIFADSRLQPRWIVEAFERVARSDFADIVLVDWEEKTARAPLLWTLYRSADRWAFGADASELFPLENRGQSPGSDPELDVAFALGALDEA